MFFHSADTPPERPADPAVRRANLRRIGRLFAPYKQRLGGVLLLIVVSAGLGVVPAFLLKRVLEAIAANDTRSLSINAAGMIAIAIATGVLGVIQTLLSNQVGRGPARCSRESRTTSAASRTSSPTRRRRSRPT
jgi:ATP-binding cassette subfamily B protein